MPFAQKAQQHSFPVYVKGKSAVYVKGQRGSNSQGELPGIMQKIWINPVMGKILFPHTLPRPQVGFGFMYLENLKYFFAIGQMPNFGKAGREEVEEQAYYMRRFFLVCRNFCNIHPPLTGLAAARLCHCLYLPHSETFVRIGKMIPLSLLAFALWPSILLHAGYDMLSVFFGVVMPDVILWFPFCLTVICWALLFRECVMLRVVSRGTNGVEAVGDEDESGGTVF